MEVAKISKEDLSLVSNNLLNEKQLGLLLSRTPKAYIKSRPGKGGGTWNYVSGTYIRKVLNLMFGWNWDFEVMHQEVMHGEAIVKGRLTCRIGNKQIVKMQFGNKEVMCKKGTDTPLSIGNDLKAAATDALKKCATELGISSDVYAPNEFREVSVLQEEISIDELSEAYEIGKDKLSATDATHIKRIIEANETASFKKAWNKLQG